MGRISKLCVLFAAFALTAAGCLPADDDDGYADDAGYGGEGGDSYGGEGGSYGGEGGDGGSYGGEGGGGEGDLCDEMCADLDTCDLCMPDDADECMSVEACADDCRANNDEAMAECVVSLPECDEAALLVCLEGGGEADVCDEMCADLDTCEMCLPDDDGGCLEIVDCAEACRVDEQQDIAQCVVEIPTCDEDQINVCLEGGEAPVLNCAMACAQLVECGLIDADSGDHQACVEDCGETVGEAQVECTLAAATCEDVEACFE